MKMCPLSPAYTFKRGLLSYSFLTTGDIFEFYHDGILINQLRGTPLTGSANNIWLRLYKDLKPTAFPLLGVGSNSEISVFEKGLVFSGKVEQIKYEVIFYASDSNCWFWDVKLEGNYECVDIVYGQDIAVADKSAVLTSELYVSQYLAHSVFEGQNGYIVCSRQNQPQKDLFPYLQQGAIAGNIIGYCTDGTQFFGLSYKADMMPSALFSDLPNKNLQFELAYTGFQTEKFKLSGKAEIAFYGLFKPNHPEAIESIEYTGEITQAYNQFRSENIHAAKATRPYRSEILGSALKVLPLSDYDIQNRYPERALEETEISLFSFFTTNDAHVVLMDKELISERPHGTIITTRINPHEVDSDLITSTNYMYGLFNGQTVVGNTTFNKFLSSPRGLLDILKYTGQRIFVEEGGKYHILTVPSAYEMGVNYSKWVYKLEDDTLEVIVYSVAERTDIVLEVVSESGKKYDFIITNQLVLGEMEFERPVLIEKVGDMLLFRPDNWSEPYPRLCYSMKINGNYTWSDDRIFFDGIKPENPTMLTVSIAKSSRFSVIISGALEGEPVTANKISFVEEIKKYTEFYIDQNSGFYLEYIGRDEAAELEVKKLNTIVTWFTHNALVHYAVPHGLEQSGGAAWGTRDVCQGPFEYFLANQKYDLCRSILLKLFSHQEVENGEWPQWFMFDRYGHHAGECHGDVLLWPLKCVGDYMEATGRYELLDVEVTYLDSKVCESLLEHIKRAVEKIEERFIGETALISYAGGDWDDTLQPADPMLKQKLSSSWTQALAYQVLSLLSRVLDRVDADYSRKLFKLAERIKNDFNKYFVSCGVIAGFVIHENGLYKKMIHPEANPEYASGICYRLIPMTRGIIAELSDPMLAAGSMDCIEQYLKFPDGVRLMDRPTQYHGGISRMFKRAEQAANVGREISLQYSHAHIRYIEALCKLGYSSAWDALFQLNPILIKDHVPNAMIRQSNMYFSSSDGAFSDRYDYYNNFDKLRRGSIGVKGGWRLYSSGPGIYIKILISCVLGIRFKQDHIIIDPVLPTRLDGLCFTFRCYDIPVTFIYHVKTDRTDNIVLKRNGKEIETHKIHNPYRDNAVAITKDTFLSSEGNIEVFIC